MSDQILSIHPHAAASFHDDGVVILNARNGRLFSSNRTGAAIWRCLERCLSLDAIADEISSEYQIGREMVREHTSRFLASLETNGLVERK